MTKDGSGIEEKVIFVTKGKGRVQYSLILHHIKKRTAPNYILLTTQIYTELHYTTLDYTKYHYITYTVDII